MWFNHKMRPFILLRGGGDLASGVALRLHRAGLRVVIAELPQPLSVRRAVSFSEAVYETTWTVEGVTGRLVMDKAGLKASLAREEIPVLVDPGLDRFAALDLQPAALVDARLLKRPPEPLPLPIPLVIGLGPGFVAGQNCQAVIETNRGHTLGRVYWNGRASPDTGQPEGDPRRVLRAPADGLLSAHAEIGDPLEAGQVVAEVNGLPIAAPFGGVLRGLLRPGLRVEKGLKLGDVDARQVREYCFLASDKSLAVGGGVLEALLAFQARRGG
jgi:xanthine dehydrogenase accessory factor